MNSVTAWSRLIVLSYALCIFGCFDGTSAFERVDWGHAEGAGGQAYEGSYSPGQRPTGDSIEEIEQSSGGERGGNSSGGIDRRGTLGAQQMFIDMSDTVRYVDDSGLTAFFEGRVISNHPVQTVMVDDAPIPLIRHGDDYVFSAEVDVNSGSQMVPVVAIDVDGRERKGHRSAVSADFLPEGALNRHAAYLPLSQALVDASTANLIESLPLLDVTRDVADEFGAIASDEACTIWPREVQHDPIQLEVEVREEGFFLVVKIPKLKIIFRGDCRHQRLGRFGIRGNMSSTPVIEARIFGRAGEDDCLIGLDADSFKTKITQWKFKYRTTGLNIVERVLVGIFGGNRGRSSRLKLKRGIHQAAQPLLMDHMSDVFVYDNTQPVNIFGKVVQMRLCATSLGTIEGTPNASLAASVVGRGDRESTGAALLFGPNPSRVDGALLLDTQLVSQLLFSAWRDGGFDSVAPEAAEYARIAAMHPSSEPLFPLDAPVEARITAELSPVVRSPEQMGEGQRGDLQIEVPDMRIELWVNQQRMASLITAVSIVLELVPNQEGELVPTPIEGGIITEAHLIDEPLVDFELDSLLEAVVAAQLRDTVNTLLLDATFRIPSVGGALVPRDVEVDETGRYLRISLR